MRAPLAAALLALAVPAAAADAFTLRPPRPAPRPPRFVPDDSRLVLGLRLGGALAGGDAAKGTAAADGIGVAIPVEAWAGWRLGPRLTVGAAGGWAGGWVGDARDAWCARTGVACSAHLWRAAARVEAGWRDGNWRPWGAAALGGEWRVERWELSSADWERRRLSGWQVAIEAGLDRPIARRFELGLFAGLRLGQYRALSVAGETAGYPLDGARAVDDPGLHRWLEVGLRGNLGLLAP